MNAKDFKERSRQFAIRVISLVDALPQQRSADVPWKAVAPQRDVGGGELSSGLQGA